MYLHTHTGCNFFSRTDATTVTMTTTPTCFQVAVTDTVATTALTQVSPCAGKKKRSIDDSPLEDVKQFDIAPSREVITEYSCHAGYCNSESLQQVMPYAFAMFEVFAGDQESTPNCSIIKQFEAQKGQYHTQRFYRSMDCKFFCGGVNPQQLPDQSLITGTTALISLFSSALPDPSLILYITEQSQVQYLIRSQSLTPLAYPQIKGCVNPDSLSLQV